MRCRKNKDNLNTSTIAVLPGLEPLKGLLPGDRSVYQGLERVDPENPTVLIAEVYKKDVVFKVKPMFRKVNYKKSWFMRKRNQIKGFTYESSRRLKLFMRNTSDMWKATLTLTYPGPSFGFSPEGLDGPTCKKHIHAFCNWLRRRKIAYVWILEFQARGTPHFHFCLSGFVDKNDVAAEWYKIVGSGDPRHLAAGTRIEGVRGDSEQFGNYMGAYVSKLEQKIVPGSFVRVGRFWGASRCITKTLYRMRSLYREVAREIRPWRKQNQGSRRGISLEQERLALLVEQEMQGELSGGTYGQADEGKRAFLSRKARRLHGRAKGYAKRWRWRGYGFTLLRGADSFRSIMRQSVAIDRSENPWELWTKEKEAISKMSIKDRLKRQGQPDLYGGFTPFYPEAHDDSLDPGAWEVLDKR